MTDIKNIILEDGTSTPRIVLTVGSFGALDLREWELYPDNPTQNEILGICLFIQVCMTLAGQGENITEHFNSLSANVKRHFRPVPQADVSSVSVDCHANLEEL